MKQLYLFLALLFSLFSFGQNAIFGEWFLYSITIDDVTQKNTFSNDFNLNIFVESSTNVLTVEGQAVCNNYSNGEQNISLIGNNAIAISLGFISTVVCSTDAENQFEYSYFSAFQYSDAPIFQYQITGENPGTGTIITLTMTNEEGNILTYGRQARLDTNVLAGEWFLYEMRSNAGTIDNFPQPVSIIFSDEINNGENSLIINGICDTYSTSYLTPIYDASFLCVFPSWSPTECMNDTQNLDNYLFDLFDSYDYVFPEGQLISYEISGSGNEQLLEISQIFYQGDGFIAIDIGHFSRQQLSVKEKNLGEGLTIYPNPASDEITISSLTQMPASNFYYSIISSDGKIIIDETSIMQPKIDVSYLKGGIYFLKIRKEDTVEILKFIKK